MNKIMHGKVWKFGDNINTDLIFPSKYLYEDQNPFLLAKYAMSPLIEDFYKKIKPGDFIVGGDNFGCGSSREQAVIALKFTGISAIVAKSFSRIFFRNLITHGLPGIYCPKLVDQVHNGDCITLDWMNNKLIFNDNIYDFTPLVNHIRDILEIGGLIPYLKDKLKEKQLD